MNYKVKKGDTLSEIAKNNGTTVSQLMKLNPKIKNANRIIVGQSINLGTPKQNTKLTTSTQESDYFDSNNFKINTNYKGPGSQVHKLITSTTNKAMDEADANKAKKKAEQTRYMKRKTPSYDKISKQQKALRQFGYKGKIDGD